VILTGVAPFIVFRPPAFGATRVGLSAFAEEMGSFEFTTWVALAGAAILAALCSIYSTSLWVLIPAALVGAFLGYKGEQAGRRYLEQYLSQRRSR
jgi:hypothetical protein